MYSTKNLIALAVVAFGVLLLVSPQILDKYIDNDIVKKISENATLLGLVLVGAGGYYFWTNTQSSKVIRFESKVPDDISTLTGSEI